MALAHYNKLKTIKPEENEFDIKIAECYFNIPYYTNAINKCNEIIDNLGIDNKCFPNIIFIKIKSLIKLKKINEAKDVFDAYKNTIEKMNDSKNEITEIVNEINNKIKNLEGQYNFKEIFKLKDSFDINIGEYVNKKLEIKNTKDKGLGIFTKEKIKIGELIVVSKAFSACPPNDNDKNNNSSLYMKYDNPDKDESEKINFPLVFKEKNKLEDILSYKLSNYPDDYSDILYLFNSNNKYINYEERKKDKNIDLKKIEKILKYNTIKVDYYYEPISKGLWFYPSFFNHSCIPNCIYFGFGDILIIIAVNEIDKNSELFINYYSVDALYDERQTYIQDNYNFKCKCELCEYEGKKIKENKENKILNEYLTRLRNNFLKNDKGQNEFMKINNEVISQKEIKQMVKFLEQNKKMFSCYEKNIMYLNCAHCMMKYDPYQSYEYLESALKYTENRNYYFEKLTLYSLSIFAKILKSQARKEFVSKKFRAFFEKYFADQQEFVNLLLKEYNIIS